MNTPWCDLCRYWHPVGSPHLVNPSASAELTTKLPAGADAPPLNTKGRMTTEIAEPPFPLDDTVKRCIAWMESPEGWFYFIETNHPSFPRYAIGERRTDGAVRAMFKCGLEDTARKQWDQLVATGELATDDPRLEPIPRVRPPFALYATIKKSSKYYHQGLSDPTNGKSKPRAFEITSINSMPDCDGYDYRLNNNQYRREDLQLWVKLPDGKLKRI